MGHNRNLIYPKSEVACLTAVCKILDALMTGCMKVSQKKESDTTTYGIHAYSYTPVGVRGPNLVRSVIRESVSAV